MAADKNVFKAGSKKEDIETEELVLYGSVKERLKKTGLFPLSAHDPSKIPPDQI